jgi:hypothetical protein
MLARHGIYCTQMDPMVGPFQGPSLLYVAPPPTGLRDCLKILECRTHRATILHPSRGRSRACPLFGPTLGPPLQIRPGKIMRTSCHDRGKFRVLRQSLAAVATHGSSLHNFTALSRVTLKRKARKSAELKAQFIGKRIPQFTFLRTAHKKYSRIHRLRCLWRATHKFSLQRGIKAK